MKVLLINPPSENIIIHNMPSALERIDASYPPLGLLYVGAYLLKYTEHKIFFLDAQIEKVDYNQLESRINQLKPDIVGIYTPTFLLVDVLNATRIIKKINKKIHICLGGPHPTLFPNETLNISEIDSIIIGEGEIAFAELVNNLNGNGKVKEIRGIGFKDDAGKAVFTEPRKKLDNLDSLPFPARRLSPYRSYYDWMGKYPVATSMITSRGCPYSCIFCWRGATGSNLYRMRSVQNIIAEIEECIAIGIREFLIFDELFTLNRKRVLDFCDEIVNRKLKIGWAALSRVDTVDSEMLKRMKKAGCYRIQYGVEAGSNETLKILKKGITLKQIEEAFKITKNLGIAIFADFMIGSPGETKAHINKTIDFAIKLEPDFLEFTITTPYPETELYDLGIRKGVIDPDHWKRFAKNPDKNFMPQFWEENFSTAELNKLLNFAYKKFYIRPGYILKRLSEIKSFKELFRKIGIGLRIFRL